ncbi:MAG: folate-binding protein YgfZ [Lysobacter sp.]|nr:folate-binding protein YgfZ [Lysobacter sp.]
MPNNPQTLSTSWFALPDHRLMALNGRDAVAFAQAQTMNDVAALRDGEWHWNGWLTPKGRVIALFALIRLDADTLWMLLPDADADAMATQLRRFVFRSKVAIAVRGDLHVAGRLSASDLASGNHWAGDATDLIELDCSGDLGNGHPGRSLRITTAAAASEDAAGIAAWHRADLEHGWPRLEAGQSGLWTPQQLSLERLRAYSVKKGCYPGQEIVARTHFLGQAKRGLALIRTAMPLSPGAELSSGGVVVGTVISTRNDTALAVLPFDLHPQAIDLQALDAQAIASLAPQKGESPALGGAFWKIEPLRPGLAR